MPKIRRGPLLDLFVCSDAELCGRARVCLRLLPRWARSLKSVPTPASVQKSHGNQGCGSLLLPCEAPHRYRLTWPWFGSQKKCRKDCVFRKASGPGQSRSRSRGDLKFGHKRRRDFSDLPLAMSVQSDNPRVFLDIEVEGDKLGQSRAPRTVPPSNEHLPFQAVSSSSSSRMSSPSWS